MNKLILGNQDDLKSVFITEDTYLQLKLENSSNDIRIELAKDVCLKVFELSKKYHIGKSYCMFSQDFNFFKTIRK